MWCDSSHSAGLYLRIYLRVLKCTCGSMNQVVFPLTVSSTVKQSVSRALSGRNRAVNCWYTGICSSGCRCRLSLSTEKMMTVWTKISFHFCKAYPTNTKRLSVLMAITAEALTKQQHCYVHEMVRQILATGSLPARAAVWTGYEKETAQVWTKTGTGRSTTYCPLWKGCFFNDILKSWNQFTPFRHEMIRLLQASEVFLNLPTLRSCAIKLWLTTNKILFF